MRQGNTALIAVVVAGTMALGGCGSTREQQGNLIGAVAGGVLGSQVGGGSGRVAATIAGTLIGGFFGSQLGRQMDENDRHRAGEALESTPTDQSSSWENPDSGNTYSVTPTRTYYEDSRPCRDYTTEAWIDGQKETVRGTACRQTDGSWLASN